MAPKACPSEKKINFSLHCIEIKRGEHNIPDLDDLWEKAEKETIDEGKGCYIFAAKPSGGDKIIPCYVGMTTDGFKKRWKSEKAIMMEILNKNKKAKLLVFAFKLLTKTGRDCKGTTKWYKDRIVFLENHLIGLAWKKNNNLQNSDKMDLSKMSIPGLVNSDHTRPKPEVKKLWDMLGKQ